MGESGAEGRKEQIIRIAAGTSRKEIGRYLGYKNSPPDERTEALIESCMEELSDHISPRFFSREYPLVILEDGTLDFSCFQVKSESLRRNLEGCSKAVLFGATLGAEVDYLIRRFTVLDMSRAVIIQAAAAAMIESFCNLENERLDREYRKKGYFLRPRFSPGYGDFSLEYQRRFFEALELEKRAGITLTDSLLMMPSKSVTALIGMSRETFPTARAEERRCGFCEKRDCLYRESEKMPKL